MTLLLLLLLSALGASEVPTSPPDPGAAARVDAHLEAFLDGTPVPGLSVVVVDHGEVVHARGFGVEVVGTERPMTASSSVGIGSLTKSFTAVMVLQLVDEGRLALDDRVVDHLPWFRTADTERSDLITVQMLLSNTSGLPSKDALWLSDLDTSPEALRRGVRALSRYRMAREPGTSFEYANEGWAVLGVLIEELTGQTWADALEDRVLEPLDMDHSATTVEGLAATGALHGHVASVDRFAPAPPMYSAVAQPAGTMLHSSARDLGSYLGALQQGRLLSPDGQRALWTPRIRFPGLPVEDGGTGGDGAYALGWVVSEIDGRRIVHHAGATLTSASETFLDVEAGLAVSLLFTAAPMDIYRFDPPYALANDLLHLWQGEPLTDFGRPRRSDPTTSPWTLPAALASRYAGLYLDPDGARLEIQPGEAPEGLVATYQLGAYQTDLALDFATEGSVVFRSLTHTLEGAFRVAVTGEVRGLALRGALSGDFRRLPEHDERSVQADSPDGRVRLVLPEGWELSWEGSRFEAVHADEAGWRVTGALGGGADGLPAAAVLVASHRETVAGRVWDQEVWTLGERSWLRSRSQVGDEPLWLLLEGSTARRTELARRVGAPLVRGIRATPARARSARPTQRSSSLARPSSGSTAR